MLFNSLKQDKRGKGDLATGIRIAILFFGGVVTLIIMGFILIVLAGNLLAPADSAMPTISAARTHNETTTTVNETGIYLSVFNLHLVQCTIVGVTNNSVSGALNEAVIDAGNYTVDNCFVNSSADVWGGLNDTTWNFTYDHTYKSRSARDMLENVTIATASFFSNALTWFTLLSIVIIIATILIVLQMTRKTTSGKSKEDL